MASTHDDSPHVGAESELAALGRQVSELNAQVAYLVARQRQTEELFEEATPILKAMMGTATQRLGALEQGGYFAFGRELIGVGQRIVEGFSPDDVRQFGDAVVSILETVRAVTQPEVLAIAGEASGVLQNAHQTEPLGIIGMVRATKDEDVQKGMAVMMEVMRHVGRAVQLMADRRTASPMEQKKARLAAITGARKKRVLGVERTTVAAQPSQRSTAPTPSPSCGVPLAMPQAVAATIDGVGFAADGHLADPSAWTRDLALKLAAAQGIALDEPRWKVIEFVRGDFESTGVSPNIRRITQATGLSTKDIYALFPRAPARTAAKIAGAPKPAGCI